MELSKYKIANFKTKKARTEKTDFQESISENNQDLFFAYTEHFKKKIDFNQNVNDKYTLLQYAYHVACWKKDFTIFEWLYNHPDVDKNKESDTGETLLSLASYHKRIDDFKRFEKDGILDFDSKDVISSFFENLPILANNVDFSLLEYILKDPKYHLKNNIKWCLSGLNDYYYRTGQKKDIKNIIFKLQEVGGLFCSDSDNHKLFFYKVISKGDSLLLEEILNNKNFRDNFKHIQFDDISEHPFYNILNFSLNNIEIFNTYIKNPLPLNTLKEEDYRFFYSLFSNFIKPFKKNAETILEYMMAQEFDPFNHERNTSFGEPLVSRIFDIRDTEILPFIKIIEKNPKFNINTAIYFNDDSSKSNILKYAYKSKITDKKSVIKYVSQHPSFLLNNLEQIDISPLLLSFMNDDDELFKRALDNLDCNFKNKKGENLLIHLFNYEFHQYELNDYINKFMNQDNDNLNHNKFFSLISHIIKNMDINELSDNKNKIAEASYFFKRHAINASYGKENTNINNFDTKVISLCEQRIINNVIHKENNIDNSLKKKRI